MISRRIRLSSLDIPLEESWRDRNPARALQVFAKVLISLLALAGCGQPPPPPAPAPIIDRAVWRKVALGMTPEQVKAALGEPKSVETEANVVCWYYLAGQPLERHAVEANRWMVPRGSVLFSSKAGNLRVIEWRDP